MYNDSCVSGFLRALLNFLYNELLSRHLEIRILYYYTLHAQHLILSDVKVLCVYDIGVGTYVNFKHFVFVQTQLTRYKFIIIRTSIAQACRVYIDVRNI